MSNTKEKFQGGRYLYIKSFSLSRYVTTLSLHLYPLLPLSILIMTSPLLLYSLLSFESIQNDVLLSHQTPVTEI